MSWEDEQERLTREGRLLVSSPAEVFRELKAYGQRIKKNSRSYDEQLEVGLLERGEPLVDLGLACYAASGEVLATLYKRAIAATDDPAEIRYRKGLRIAFFSNECFTAKKYQAFEKFDSFPITLIGKEEFRRVLAEAGNDEIEALICNPSIHDGILQSLYEYKEPFSGLSEERWRDLITLSAKNERLTTEKDNRHDPDFGFMKIHESIFHLLEIAPLKLRWMHTLYELFFDRLNFQMIAHHPKNIDHVLSRWAAEADEKDDDGKPYPGLYTRLSYKDEFRCLIAAMYGGGYSDGKSFIHGGATASDVALRCAYYGKANLTLDEMKESYKRDGGVYIFAVMLNHIYDARERTKLFEDQLSDWRGSGAGLLSMVPRYHNYLKQLRQARPQDAWRVSRFEEPKPKNELLLLTDSNELMAGVKTLATDINKKINSITKQIDRLSWAIPVLGFLALLIYLKR